VLKAVLFDFDGLILDTESPEFQSWCEVYESHGQVLEVERWVVAIGTRDAFDPYAHLAGLLGLPVDVETIRASRRQRMMQLIEELALLEGVETLLDEARELGLRTAVVSSADRDWVCGHLDRYGVTSRFEAIVCGGEHLPAKPEPALYLEALRLLDVSAEDAVALEDSPNGIAAAKAAGVYCIAVPNSMTSGMDLSRADLIVPSLAAVSLGSWQS